MASGNLLMGKDDGDNKWCFNHEIALIMRKSLAPNAKARLVRAALDFEFMHKVAVLVRLHKQWHVRIQWHQLEDHGEYLSVTGDHAFRWEGFYRINERFQKLGPAIVKLYEEAAGKEFKASIDKLEDKPKDFFSAAFWGRLQQYHKILETIHIISKRAQAQMTSVCGLIPFWIYEIKNHLEVQSVSDCDEACELKNQLLIDFEDRFSKQLAFPKAIALKACALDPRTALMSKYCGISADVVDQVWREIALDAEELYAPKPLFSKKTSEQMNTSHLQQGLLKKTQELLQKSDLDLKVKSIRTSIDIIRETLETQCEELQSQRISKGDDEDFYSFNPLKDFWNLDVLRKEAFQPIRDAALVVLSAPAGTGGVEATGSVLNRIVTPLTNRLTEEHAEQMVVIGSFIRDSDFDFLSMLACMEKELQDICD
jgi:hypothetical protein